MEREKKDYSFLVSLPVKLNAVGKENAIEWALLPPYQSPSICSSCFDHRLGHTRLSGPGL